MLLDRYKHISFDLDGTLVHTVPEYRHKIVPEVVRKLGGKLRDIKSVDKFWFEPDREETIKSHFGLDPMAFWKLFRFTDVPQVREQHTHAYSDAEPTLRRLKAMGKMVSIITGSPDWIAEMEIRKINNAPIDHYVSINYDQIAGKPDPGAMHVALETLASMPHETLYIGNSNEDANFANNAGVDFVYLERREHPFENWEAVAHTIHSLEQLFEL